MTSKTEKRQQRTEHSVTSPIIETLGISRVFRVAGQMVSPVSDVTVRVGYGDFAVIFGRSGAGKSTLMNMLMGLDEPDLGEVFLKGESLFGYSEEQRTTIRRKKVSFLPQTTLWVESMDLLDNVAMPLYLLGESRRKARKKALQQLGEVGLQAKATRKPSELSSGQQQIAGLARALIKEPWLIFADEPTAHLDTRSAEEVTQILLNASKNFGITTVMVTHDLNFLNQANKWLFMQDGRCWDIQDHSYAFKDIREALEYVEDLTLARAAR